MKKPWQKIDSKITHKNPYWELREDKVIQPDGREGVYYVINKPAYAMTIALTGKNEVFLIRQWRYIAGKNSWEFPAGAVDKNESLREASLRELKEETGVSAEKITKIKSGVMNSNGFTTESFCVFVAEELTLGEPERGKTEQDMICQKFTIAEVEEMIDRGEIHDAPTVAAIYFLKKYLEKTAEKIRKIVM